MTIKVTCSPLCKIVFGSKRVSFLSGRVFDPKDFRALEVSLASFVEL